MLLPFQGAETLLCGSPKVSLRLPWACAPLGFQPALANTTYCTTVDNGVVFWPCNCLSITDIEMATMTLESAG